MPAPLLTLSGIGKSFDGVRVLGGVSIELNAGEVHVLAGENGAGKSTLIKILAGIHADYEGAIQLSGRTVRFDSPIEARRAGIAVIHQELSLVDSMNLPDNIHLGRESATLGGLWLDRPAQLRRTREVCRQLNLELDEGDFERPVGSFSLSVRNRIEIAKALAFDARILVMDEPTSALDKPEVDKLFALIEAAKKRGCGIIYISHKMEEIYRVADRITVLRDGSWVGSAPARDCPEPTLIRWMVGRELTEQFPPRLASRAGGAVPRLSVLGLRIADADESRRDAVANVSFHVNPGEILGIAGLQGSGNTELFGGLFGSGGAAREGVVTVDGKVFRPRSPRDSIDRGIAYLTADRKSSGLILGMSVEGNLSLASMSEVSPAHVLRPALERSRAAALVQSLGIRLASPGQAAGTLSGGNQQKVVIGKWLGTRPRVLFLEDPTRGVDVGAKRDIYRLMRSWTAEGMAILLISSELPELLGLCDRILVLHRGEVSAQFNAGEATQETLLAAAMGS